jgi:anti-sigma factor RsiW
MESNFEERDDNMELSGELSENDDSFARFELLSAYLDGEVTAAERKQVQQWLDTDPQIQKLYMQLSRLHQDIDSIPVVPDVPSTTQLSEQVFQQVDRDRRSKRLALLGGGAIAAIIIGTLSNLLFGHNSPIQQMANESVTPSEPDTEELTIALNRPIVEIPAEVIPPANEIRKSLQK